jgi:flagellar protein FliS
MVRGNPRQQYTEAHLVSSSPGETVLMLYEGAIRFLQEAVTEIAAQNITAKVRLLERAEKIIDYLKSCLDKENGGEIAENLDKLYDYLLTRLTEANFYNDVGKLKEIEKLLATVREGWISVCNTAKKKLEPKDPQHEEGAAAAKKITVSV